MTEPTQPGDESLKTETEVERQERLQREEDERVEKEAREDRKDG